MERGEDIIKIDASELELVNDLLDIYKRIYQHEHTPQVTKDYIHYELKKYLKPEFNIKRFLNEKD